jgi:hypothetical protein
MPPVAANLIGWPACEGNDPEPHRFCEGTTGGPVPLQLCGPTCEVLSLDFRMDLAANRTGWYQKIADRAETDVLIAADKNSPKIVENDPLLRFEALILFKSPLQA